MTLLAVFYYDHHPVTNHHDCLVYDACIVYQEGQTALMLASRRHEDIAKYLAAKGADLDIQDNVSVCCAYVYMHAFMRR